VCDVVTSSACTVALLIVVDGDLPNQRLHHHDLVLDLVGRRVAPVGLTKFHLTRGPPRGSNVLSEANDKFPDLRPQALALIQTGDQFRGPRATQR
jgi:hypothetical protein